MAAVAAVALAAAAPAVRAAAAVRAGATATDGSGDGRGGDGGSGGDDCSSDLGSAAPLARPTATDAAATTHRHHRRFAIRRVA